MGKSKTEKLVRRIVQDSAKSSMYSKEELAYIRLQIIAMKMARQKKKLTRKAQKGFTPTYKTGKNSQQENSSIQSEQKLEES